MSPIVLATFGVVALVVAVLSFYLYWVSKLLNSIADGLGEVDAMVHDVIGHAETIVPDLQHANHTLGTISGALPLLYGLAEKIHAKQRAAQPAGAGRKSGTGA
ncbi:MAG: hypothetical protein ACRD0C_01235 [Acidimicrobiia bacterium]